MKGWLSKIQAFSSKIQTFSSKVLQDSDISCKILARSDIFFQDTCKNNALPFKVLEVKSARFLEKMYGSSIRVLMKMKLTKSMDKIIDGGGWITSASQRGQSEQSRIIPIFHVALFNQLKEYSFHIFSCLIFPSGNIYVQGFYQPFICNANQGRTCGKGVGKGLKYWKTNYLLHCHLIIFGYVSQIPVIQF